MSTLVLSRPSEKHCRGCGRLLPLERFRRYRVGQDWPRHSDCNACRNRRERDQRRRQRLRRTRERLFRLAAERNVERLSAAVQAILSACGGMDGFAKDVDVLLRSGSPAVKSRLHRGMMALMLALDEAQRGEEDRRRSDAAALEEAASNRMIVSTSEQILCALPPHRLRPIMERLQKRLSMSPSDDRSQACPA
ncbi:MAG: hypothetical protein AB7U20_03250 [Planctomycetaceae bacterium]